MRIALVSGVAFLAVETTARACSFAALTPHTLDPAEQAVDTSPPSSAQVRDVVVKRGTGSDGCGGGSSGGGSCDGFGTVSFTVSSEDDRTAPADIGYRISLARGTAPPSLMGIGETVRAPFAGHLTLVWFDDAPDDQQDLDFDIEVRAVDLAGNVSPTAAVVRVHDTNTACEIAVHRGNSGPAIIVVGLVALVLVRSRRLRR